MEKTVFELNTEYKINNDSFVFVRRTAKCIFDKEGNRYKVKEREESEFIWPYGAHSIHLFASHHKA